jgi:glutamine amidotransferase
MCRHTAYLGPPASLRSLLIDPPHSLYRQSWAPRRQRHGTVNADGFGIGWYAPPDPVPARYRQGSPIWGDESLPDLARVVQAGAVLAAVRSATAGTARGAEAAAPFAAGPWLFSHNGVAEGWRDWGEHALVRAQRASGGDYPQQAAPGSEDRQLAGSSGGGPQRGPRSGDPQPGPGGQDPCQPAASLLSSLEALVDSAFLWVLVLGWLRAGWAMGAALDAAVGAVAAAGGTGRFNFLLTDGHSVAATACGDTLWYRQADAAVTVASEPSDDLPGWTEVPDQHLLTATPAAVTVAPLAAGHPITTRTDTDVRTEGIVIA